MSIKSLEQEEILKNKFKNKAKFKAVDPDHLLFPNIHGSFYVSLPIALF